MNGTYPNDISALSPTCVYNGIDKSYSTIQTQFFTNDNCDGKQVRGMLLCDTFCALGAPMGPFSCMPPNLGMETESKLGMLLVAALFAPHTLHARAATLTYVLFRCRDDSEHNRMPPYESTTR